MGIESQLEMINGSYAPVTAMPKKLAYVQLPGVLNLSHSRLGKLYDCPRRFQLDELVRGKSWEASAHTAFGHAYAAGVQEYLARYDELGHECARELAMCMAFASWSHPNLFECIERDDKSIESALLAVDIFIAQEAPAILSEYKIAMFGTKPAIELHAYVHIGDSYSFQLHIDLVMQHRYSGELCVFEIKSKGGASIAANWQNSDQAVGYNVVLTGLGLITDTQTMYMVKYITYDTRARQHNIFDFPKPVHIRTEWVHSLMLDVNIMEMYKEHNMWPKRGSNCVTFGRVCPHFGSCDLVQSTAHGTAVRAFESIPLSAVDYVVTMEELLETFS